MTVGRRLTACQGVLESGCRPMLSGRNQRNVPSLYEIRLVTIPGSIESVCNVI